MLGAGQQVRVKWQGSVDHDANDLLAPRRQGRSEKREACAQWLGERLSAGNAVAFKLLRAEAEAHGLNERMLQRVGKDLGVRMERAINPGHIHTSLDDPIPSPKSQKYDSGPPSGSKLPVPSN